MEAQTKIESAKSAMWNMNPGTVAHSNHWRQFLGGDTELPRVDGLNVDFGCQDEW